MSRLINASDIDTIINRRNGGWQLIADCRSNLSSNAELGSNTPVRTHRVNFMPVVSASRIKEEQ